MNLAEDLMAACDPVQWCKSALKFDPDPWQEKVLRSEAPRIIMNCCRQSGKSTIAAALALHKALYYPNSLILLISPSIRQSSENFRRVSNFMGLLQDKPVLSEDNRLSMTMENGSRIVSLPSTEETIRGYSGVDLIIEDESARVPDDLYYSTRPMLATSHGRMILLSTPFGQRGHFWQAWMGNELWQRVMITAEQCPRISKEFLEEEAKSLGDWWYRQEYLCEFAGNTDTIFTQEMIDRAMNPELQPLFPIAPLIGDGSPSSIRTINCLNPDLQPLFPLGLDRNEKTECDILSPGNWAWWEPGTYRRPGWMLVRNLEIEVKIISMDEATGYAVVELRNPEDGKTSEADNVPLKACRPWRRGDGR